MRVCLYCTSSYFGLLAYCKLMNVLDLSTITFFLIVTFFYDYQFSFLLKIEELP